MAQMVEVFIANRWIRAEIIRENVKTAIVRVFEKHRKTGAKSFIVKVKRRKIRN